MKILLGMGHPKHFWMFKQLIDIGKKRNWEFKILLKKKDVLENLVKSEGFDYEILGKHQPKAFWKILEMNRWVINTLKYSREFEPELFMGGTFLHFAFASVLNKKRYIIFEDSEPANWVFKIALPFSNLFITPTCFRRELGKKHIKLNTYLELSYLHPNRFKPDPRIIKKYGLDDDEKYAILRFVAWKAYHDIGKFGLNLNIKRKLIKILEKNNFNIYISSEAPLEKEFEKYQIRVPPKHIHHLLSFARIYFGDSQTMATESALLGTPAVRTNSFVGRNDMGNFIELENRYRLLFSRKDPKDAINIANKLIQKKNIKVIWGERVNKMLKEKIDLTSFNIWFIENYPDSIAQARNYKSDKYKT